MRLRKLDSTKANLSDFVKPLSFSFKVVIVGLALYGGVTLYKEYTNRLTTPDYLKKAVAYASQKFTHPIKEVEAEKNEKLDFEYYYQETRRLESSYGTATDPTATNVHCANEGKINEIGYFAGGDRYFCFEDEKEQQYTFYRWLQKRLDSGLSLSQAMCLYVTGTPTDTCDRVTALGL